MIRRPPRAAPISIAAILLLLCLVRDAAFVRAFGGSYSHTIRYGEEECLLIRVPKDQPHLITGSFDCLDTAVPTDPIRVALWNSEEKMIWSSPYGANEGTFSEKGVGKHWLCLENGLTYEQNRERDGTNERELINPRVRITRTMGFSLHVKKSLSFAAAETLGEGGDVDGTTGKLMELADQLSENFMALEDHMSFMKAREMVHRELHEQTFTKVVMWNVLEICAVVLVTFGQVLNVWWILSKRNNSYY